MQVPVYEYTINGDQIMRRRADDYINATHILKSAGFDKPARTRILEREVQKGIHEKVQGGYGKYQGLSTSEEHITRAGLTLNQVHGYLSLKPETWRKRTVCTTNSDPSSTTSLAIVALPQHRSTPQPNQANPEHHDHLPPLDVHLVRIKNRVHMLDGRLMIRLTDEQQ